MVEAIHAGQIETVQEPVRVHPGLASARLVEEKGGSGTPLQAATDWAGVLYHKEQGAKTAKDTA